MTSAFKAGTSAFEQVSFAEHELADFEPELLQSEEELAIYNGKEVFEAEAWLNEEIILNEEETLSFKADEENSSEHPSLKQSSPRVGVDRLCSSSNTVGKVCTIKDKTLRFSTDLHYKSELTIVLDNTKIKCLTIAYSPCSFMISLQGKEGTQLVLKNGSTITGKQIIIGAPHAEVHISDDSSLWASGQSIMTQGTQNQSIGAAFVGQAGYCGGIPGFRRDRQPTYGDFSRLPEMKDLSKYDNEIGSIGKLNDVETAGGGRILVYADSVTFEGAGAKIQANARPYHDQEKRRYSLQGGSGGYIYIRTAQKYKKDSLSPESTIEAKGGNGVGLSTSGSGGVVIFDGGFTTHYNQTIVSGGIHKKNDKIKGFCANGAAGTLYNAETDHLYIDNKNITTEAATTLVIPKSRQHNSEKGISELAKELVVADRANVIIKGEHFGLTFDKLWVGGHSVVEFGQQKDTLYIRFLHDMRIDKDAVLDFTKTSKVFIYQHNEKTAKDTITTIGRVYFREQLAINGKNVNLIGDIRVPQSESNHEQVNTVFVVESENLTVYENVTIRSGFQMLHANETIDLRPGAKIESTRKYMCNIHNNAPDMYTCLDSKHKWRDSISFTDIVKRFNQQFPKSTSKHKNIMRFEQMWDGLQANYTTYIQSLNNLKMDETLVKGPRIGICASNVQMHSSRLNTDGHGCPSDFGFGKGLKYAICAGSGGANGGEGGHGGLELTKYHEKCADKHPHAYYNGLMANYEGSGGASADAGKRLGGTGGGIVRLMVLNEFRAARSLISANGDNGTKGETIGSGGGAGGTIEIVSSFLKGESKVEAKGGHGSEAGGGGGAGGRLFVGFIRGFDHDQQPEQSHYWRGVFDLEGGLGGSIDQDLGYLAPQNGQTGVVKASKCFGGYTGPFCKPCQTGTFKYDYSFASCQPCENKPVNSFYTDVGASTSSCPYECSNGLDPVSVNPLCKNAIELQVNRLGGVFSALGFFAAFMMLVLFIWIALIAHSKYILRADKSFRSTVYDGVLFNSDAETDPTELMAGPRNLQMHDSDIWSHSHRMYLLGENSINFPWYMPKDFPARALNPENKDKFIRFIKSRQDVLNWTSLQKDTYLISRVLCPPIANLIHRCFRRKHFDALQDQLYANFDSSFWDQESKGRTLRISSSTTDNQLAFIDFMDYEKRKKDYIGPQLPLTLMLAGSGTFNSPYYCNFEDDALAKSIVYFHKATLKDSLPLWFENLNTLLSKLSFFKLSGATSKDLSEVIDWVEMGNKTLFNPLDTKATLYLFENSYHGVEGGSFKQRRRSFPLESVVLEAFPEMFTSLIRFVKTKLMARKSEIRLGLVFRPFNEEKRRALNERIRRITAQQKQDQSLVSSRAFDQASTNLIYGSDSEDNGEEDESYSYAKANVSKAPSGGRTNLGKIRSNDMMLESSTALLSEANMESSDVYIYGSGEQATSVKIVDKSKRAYDISGDAVKSLELALQKPRTSCKHKILRFRGWWYAVWSLFFKHHGIPPKSGSRYQYFFGFSFFVALDALLTLATVFHMFNPLENWQSIGIPYFFISPAATVLGPLTGILACCIASPKLLKFQASANATAVILNYPLTLATMILTNDEPFYIAIIIVLWFNKICLSFFGSKVRQHLINPGFCRNIEKIEDRFNIFVQAKQEFEAGVTGGMTAAERAARLAKHGPPAVGIESDEDEGADEDEDDTSFGIIPKNRLEPIEDLRQNLTEF